LISSALHNFIFPNQLVTLTPGVTKWTLWFGSLHHRTQRDWMKLASGGQDPKLFYCCCHRSAQFQSSGSGIGLSVFFFIFFLFRFPRSRQTPTRCDFMSRNCTKHFYWVSVKNKQQQRDGGVLYPNNSSHLFGDSHPLDTQTQWLMITVIMPPKKCVLGSAAKLGHICTEKKKRIVVNFATGICISCTGHADLLPNLHTYKANQSNLPTDFAQCSGRGNRIWPYRLRLAIITTDFRMYYYISRGDCRCNQIITQPPHKKKQELSWVGRNGGLNRKGWLCLAVETQHKSHGIFRAVGQLPGLGFSISYQWTWT